MNREAIAWLLIGLLVLALAAAIAWRVHYSRDRMIERRRRWERAGQKRRRDEENG